MTDQNYGLDGDFTEENTILDGAEQDGAGITWDAGAALPDSAAGVVIDGTDGEDVLTGTIDDDVLNGLDGSDSLTGLNGDDILDGGKGNDSLFGGFGADTLIGGRGSDSLTGGAGADTLKGGNGNDTLFGGNGSDKLEGGNGNDTYEFDVNQGNDRILDAKGLGDTIKFAAGITLSDLVVTHSNTDGNAYKDLTIGFAGDSGTITIEEVFRSKQVGVRRQVDFFEFDDGTIMTREEFFTATYHAGTSGNETLLGTRLDDTFTSSLGDDKYKGGKGNDTYTVEFDEGDDQIFESGGAGDTIVFGTGITAADLVVSASDADGNEYSDLTISFVSNTGSITILDLFREDATGNKRQIEFFQFEDGTELTLAEFIQQIYLVGTSGADILIGTPNDDIFSSSDGADIMVGGFGDDTYHVEFDEGLDQIYDDGGSNDKVVFGTGITFADLYIRAGDILFTGDGAFDSHNDLFITFVSNTGGLLVSDVFVYNDDTASTVIEIFEFDDGSQMTIQDMLTNSYHLGNAASNIIYGTHNGDIFTFSAGDDTYISGNGNDTFTLGKDSGDDRIYEFGGDNGDKIIFDTGITVGDLTAAASDDDLDGIYDLTISFLTGTGSITLNDVFHEDILGKFLQVDIFEFSDGTILTQQEFFTTVYQSGTVAADFLLGTYNSDIFFSSTGDDYYQGGHGHDTFNFDVGHGDDTIFENGADSGDTIVFAAGITVADMIGSATDADGNGHYNLTVNFTDIAGGSFTLQDVFHADIIGKSYQIDFFEFDDGTILTRKEFFTAVYQSGTAGADDLLGTYKNDVFGDSADDDRYSGGEGHDEYHVEAGSGEDRIYEDGGNSGDRIVFGAGITLANIVAFTTDGDDDGNDDLTLTYDFDSGSITIEDFFQSGTTGNKRQIEFFEFEDGTEMTKADFIAALNYGNVGTAGADTMVGSNYGDTLTGGAEDDDMYGINGNDTIYGEDGADLIDGGVGDDYIDGGNDDDDLYGDAGNDTLYGGSGEDFLSGGDNDDYLDGGADDDSLYGEAGSDTLVGGSGVDFLSGGTEADTLYGNSNIDSLHGDEGDDTLYGGSGDDSLYGGTENDDLYGGTGDDSLYGDDGNDTLNGGAGVDFLFGGGGNDTFVFTSASDSVTGFVDVIGDFVTGEDVIDLSDITLGAATFLGTGAFTTGGTAEVNYSVDGFGHANVLVDVDGDGVADMQFDVASTAVLLGADFIF